MKRRLMALILILSVVLPWSVGKAEDKLIYVLCAPKSYVNVRKTPCKSGEESGRLDCGDSVMTDGKKKNGYLHIYGITEDGEGWIFAGFVVDDEPVIEENCYASVAASGRVKARRYINGRRIHWLQPCTELKVYAMSAEWSVTSMGYVKTEFLEVWHE